ncbi:MAG: 3-hydroxyacyl-CoA dehydrogenase NAD-binding domain-containing protein [Steroidobacteraceae bacterium]
MRKSKPSAIFGELARLRAAQALLCSSASALLPDDFLEGSACQRLIVAHPFNPCYLLSAVELVPSRWTSMQRIDQASRVLRSVGLSPVVMRKPIFGYIGNRLQAAVMDEAMALIADGAATPNELDAVMTGALGPRWALSGPIETMDLNAPGGITEYTKKYAAAYAALGESLGCRKAWTAGALRTVIASRRAHVPVLELPVRARDHDAALAQLRAALDRIAFARK